MSTAREEKQTGSRHSRKRLTLGLLNTQQQEEESEEVSEHPSLQSNEQLQGSDQQQVSAEYEEAAEEGEEEIIEYEEGEDEIEEVQEESMDRSERSEDDPKKSDHHIKSISRTTHTQPRLGFAQSNSARKYTLRRHAQQSQGSDENQDEEQESFEQRSRTEEMPSEEPDYLMSEVSDEEGIGKDAYHGWRSTLLKSGQGPFLQPNRLQEKISLQMTKYGLQQTEPEAYGLITDMTE
jgi:hypothetical protein